MEKRNISIYWLFDKMITKKHTDSELNHIFNQAEAMRKEERLQDFKEGFQAALESLQGANNLVQSKKLGGNNE